MKLFLPIPRHLIAIAIAALGSVSISIAAERPLLDSPASAFVAFYGEAKSVDTALGKVRVWKRGPFLITHVEGQFGPSSVSITRRDGTEMSRREAFAIGTRYCGNQDWFVLSKNSDSEVFTNADRSIQLTYATPAGKEKHVTITCFLVPNGIDQL